MESFDPACLEWGYTRAFRAVRVPVASIPPGPSPGKWISFLPASMPFERRREVFDDLAGKVLSTPGLVGKAYLAKMALNPLAIAPDRIALMFYCQEKDKQAVRPLLQKLARAHRIPLLRTGQLKARDGYLGGWTFKTDAQTAQEMKQGTHDAQVSLWMQLCEVTRPGPSRPRGPRP